MKNKSARCKMALVISRITLTKIVKALAPPVDGLTYFSTRIPLDLDECSGRAPLYLTHGIMNGYGLICSEGERWNVQRKFTLDFMRKYGMSKLNQIQNSTLEEKIHHCLDILMEGKYVP